MRCCASGGSGFFTDPFRVTGVGTDNKFQYAITGTWVGTLQLFRSCDGPDSGFVTDGSTFAAPASGFFDPGAEFDNIIQWYKIGFPEITPSLYTSRSAQISLSYPGFQHAGVARVTGYTSPTQVDIEVLSNFSGNIALGATYTDAFVGLPYQGRYLSGALAYGSEAGTSMLQRTRVAQAGLLLADTHRDALRMGPGFAVSMPPDAWSCWLRG